MNKKLIIDEEKLKHVIKDWYQKYWCEKDVNPKTTPGFKALILALELISE